MKILVCIKQIPDTTDIKWTENNTIQREGLESVINPYDIFAIQEALNIKKILRSAQNDDMKNTEITAISMGPLQAQDILNKAIAMGCDNAVLLSDKKFSGADTYATAKTISSAIKTNFPDFDLIFCGQFAIDGDTAQTGPGIASFLNIPQVTFVKNIKKYEENSLYAVRELEDGFETVKVEFPALICVLKGDYEPVRPTIQGTIKAQNTKIRILGVDDIGLTSDDVGIKGSPTYVSKAFRPEHNRGECSYCSDIDELANKIKEYINE